MTRHLTLQGHGHMATCGPSTLSSRLVEKQLRHRTSCKNIVTYAIDPSIDTQDIIIGGAIVLSVGAALLLGLQKEPEVCSSCQGSGGVVCFACNGSGVMESDVSPEIRAQARRETLGRNAKKNECRACKGVGRLLCKQCQGSGYS